MIIETDIEEVSDELPEEDEDPYCHTCRGTGEGIYDGASCSTCGGSGGLSLAEKRARRNEWRADNDDY